MNQKLKNKHIFILVEASSESAKSNPSNYKFVVCFFIVIYFMFVI